jgi:hypothetical protein
MPAEVCRTTNDLFYASMRVAAEAALRVIERDIPISDRVRMTFGDLHIRKINISDFKNERAKFYWDYLKIRIYGSMRVTCDYRRPTLWQAMLGQRGQVQAGYLSGEDGSLRLEIGRLQIKGTTLATSQLLCHAKLTGFWFPRNMVSQYFPHGFDRELSELMKKVHRSINVVLEDHPIKIRALQLLPEVFDELPPWVKHRPPERFFIALNARELFLMEDR